MATGTEPRLMKEQAARNYLGGLSHGTFFRLRQEKAIPVYKIGASVYWDKADLDKFIDRLRVQQERDGAL